jgi:hypothetical protein
LNRVILQTDRLEIISLSNNRGSIQSSLEPAIDPPGNLDVYLIPINLWEISAHLPISTRSLKLHHPLNTQIVKLGAPQDCSFWIGLIGLKVVLSAISFSKRILNLCFELSI